MGKKTSLLLLVIVILVCDRWGFWYGVGVVAAYLLLAFYQAWKDVSMRA